MEKTGMKHSGGGGGAPGGGGARPWRRRARGGRGRRPDGRLRRRWLVVRFSWPIRPRRISELVTRKNLFAELDKHNCSKNRQTGFSSPLRLTENYSNKW